LGDIVRLAGSLGTTPEMENRMMRAWQIQDYIAVDVETTGLCAGIDEMIEIGGVKIENGMLTQTYQSFIKPQGMLPERIIQLTGITKEMLCEQRKIGEVLPEFLAFAGELPLLGHNLSFDYSFLKAACKKQHISYERKGTDTLRLLRILNPSMEKKNLQAAAAAYGVDPGQAHRACDDAITCAKIYLKLAEEFGEQKQELFFPQTVKASIKKCQPATEKQKKYLLDLLKYHRIEGVSIEAISKSDASALIDYLRTGQMQKVAEKLDALIREASV